MKKLLLSVGTIVAIVGCYSPYRNDYIEKVPDFRRAEFNESLDNFKIRHEVEVKSKNIRDTLCTKKNTSLSILYKNQQYFYEDCYFMVQVVCSRPDHKPKSKVLNYSIHGVQGKVALDQHSIARIPIHESDIDQIIVTLELQGQIYETKIGEATQFELGDEQCI